MVWWWYGIQQSVFSYLILFNYQNFRTLIKSDTKCFCIHTIKGMELNETL